MPIENPFVVYIRVVVDWISDRLVIVVDHLLIFNNKKFIFPRNYRARSWIENWAYLSWAHEAFSVYLVVVWCYSLY